MKKIRFDKKSCLVFALVLVLAFATLCEFGFVGLVRAAETATPQNWVNLISQTPGGAWRPEHGVTKYPWPHWFHDPAHTGYSPGPAPNTNHTLWRADIKPTLWSRVVVDNGRVVTTGELSEKALISLDAYTGEPIYAVTGPVPNTYVETIHNGYVYAGSQMLTVYDELTGTLAWTFENITNVSPWVTALPPGTVFRGDTLFFVGSATVAGELRRYGFAFEYVTHNVWEERWRIEGRRGFNPFYNGKVYYSYYGAGANIECVDATTGASTWNYTGVEGDTFFNLACDNGKVYAASGRLNYVYSVDADTGNEVWKTQLIESDYLGTNIVAGYGNVYVGGGREGNFYALNGETGEIVWKGTITGTLTWDGPRIADGKVYFCATAEVLEGFPFDGTYPGAVYCVNAATGEPIWRYTFEKPTECLSIADGYVYAANDMGFLYCIGKGPTTTTVSVTSSSPSLGQSIGISGSVADMSPYSQKHPQLQSPVVAGVPVVLSYVKDGTWSDFATVNTANDGTFLYSWTPPTEGAYRVVARFEGSDSYQWSSGQATIQANPAVQASTSTGMPSEYLIIAVVVFAIAIVAVVIILRRRQTTQK